MYTSDSEIAFTVIISIVSLILFLILFITFLNLSKNVKLIKEKLSSGNEIAKAMILISDDKKNEAIEIIRVTFLQDCISILDENWFEISKCDSLIDDKINLYLRKFKLALPDIKKDLFLFEYKKVRKFYIEE